MARSRWLILAAGLTGQATAASFLYGLPLLIPELQQDRGLSLPAAGLLVAAPLVGLLLGLIAWGAAADHYGERAVMVIGLAGTGVLLLVSLTLPGLALFWLGLVAAGVCAASVNAASGRVVLGWFAPAERGLAMGIRQTSTPLGVTIAALSLPPIAQHQGVSTAIALPAVLCLASAVFVLVAVRDPARPPAAEHVATGSPYRDRVGGTLVRVHTASALLVAPQMLAGTFAATYLVTRLDWSPIAAGQLVGVVNVVGAAARIGAGVWSDRVSSRLRPMRTIAVVAAGTMLLWGLGDLVAPWLAVTALVAALIVTVTDNGLGFTATAELAGSQWAGRALGVQNTAQNAVAMAAAPLFGLLIAGAGYPVALLGAAVFPALGAAVTPTRGESRHGGS
jgi:sugar phosphate permease